MTRVCDICGKEFKPNSSSQKRCSPECMKEAHNRRSHDYYWSHREEQMEYSRNYYREHKPESCGKTMEECLNCNRPGGCVHG